MRDVSNNSMTMESFVGEKRFRLGSGKLRLEMDGVRQRVLVGNILGRQSIEIDAEMNTIRIKSPSIIIDAHDIFIKGHTRFQDKVEVVDDLYSYKRLLVNEVNDSIPRVVTAPLDSESQNKSYQRRISTEKILSSETPFSLLGPSSAKHHVKSIGM
jgi:hypothetical protein